MPVAAVGRPGSNLLVNRFRPVCSHRQDKTAKGGPSMRKSFFCLFAALLILAGLPGTVPADIVSYSFIGTIEDGYRMGDSGTGSFTYDDTLIVNGDEVLDPTNGLTVSFSFDGQLFTQTHDADFDTYPMLEFDDYTPVYLDYVLVNGQNDVAFGDNQLSELETSGLLPSSAAGYDFETTLMATPVPIPGTVWLLGSGLVGLIGLRRRSHG
jgi:hypothetical protein